MPTKVMPSTMSIKTRTIGGKAPFIYTATGLLGDKRETMLQNEILMRPKLGTPRCRAHYVEDDAYAYGISTDNHGNTAALALTGWAGCFAAPKDVIENKSKRDFMTLNRDALQTGLVTAPENSMYRAHNDVILIPKETRTDNRVRRFPSSMVFGIPTRPSTPIFDLLEHKYQDRWIQQRHEQDILEKHNKNRIKECRGYMTRASLLRQYQNPVEEAPLWQLPRFTQSAKPHLQTFRTTKDKKNAFINFGNDRIARKSNFGHGVYNSALN